MENLTDTIKKLELSLLKPEVRSSKDMLDKLIADDFIEFGTSGNKYTKKDILDRLPNSPEDARYQASDFSIEMSPENFVVVKFKTKKIINKKETIFSSRVSYWRKTDLGWQIFYHKSTPII
ncbi:MAG: DUF4440 domain-containing protein [Rickettsiaceae bacterium]|nr:DUF4440 domain-containing protein [Rickettsiaceae bacterium]USN94508.1 MAG: DUF4440 domain-containing protein [Candidatus Nomurabacteria bacterium]